MSCLVGLHFPAFNAPLQRALLQPLHDAAQLAGEGGDVVEGEVQLPQTRTAHGRVKGQDRPHAVPGHVERAQSWQAQDLGWQGLELVALEIQTSQSPETLKDPQKKDGGSVPLNRT